jgi:hypothetical protein
MYPRARGMWSILAVVVIFAALTVAGVAEVTYMARKLRLKWKHQ